VGGGRMTKSGREAALGAAGFLMGAVIWAAAPGIARAAAAPAPEAMRLGVVDMQAVISQSARGQRARAQLQVETDAKQKDMTAREEEVRKLQADLERQKAVLSPAALREKEEAIQRKVRDIRRIAEDGNRDLQKREGELVGDIQRDVLLVITEYGKEKGYHLVLERSAGIWYVGDRADLTKDIIERFNAKAGGRP
jgi:outer membrane protein